MVLIFNPDENYSNYKLFDYLVANDVDFIIINPYEISNLSIIQSVENQTKLSINDIEIEFEKISCIFSTSSNMNLCLEINDFYDFREDILHFINKEWYSLNEFLGYLLKKRPHLSIPYDNENKLITNEIAKNTGFNIIDSIISTDNNRIKFFFEKRNERVFFSKRVNEFLSGHKTNGNYFQHEGSVFNIDELADFESQLIPSTSQQFFSFFGEIRCIFMNGNIFCVINHSTGTGVEMPYIVDDSIKTKINQLMNILKLKFGSIDLLIDEKYNYYFLEVNPHGQFDIIDTLGDFEIYKNIFNFIINEK
jgi:hypothetical protein